jgi:TP901 family phage tail tape measure protein
MPEVVAQPTVEVLGTFAALDKALQGAEKRLDTFAKYVASVGTKVQSSFGTFGKNLTTEVNEMVVKTEAVVNKASKSIVNAKKSEMAEIKSILETEVNSEKLVNAKIVEDKKKASKSKTAIDKIEAAEKAKLNKDQLKLAEFYYKQDQAAFAAKEKAKLKAAEDAAKAILADAKATATERAVAEKEVAMIQNMLYKQDQEAFAAASKFKIEIANIEAKEIEELQAEANALAKFQYKQDQEAFMASEKEKSTYVARRVKEIAAERAAGIEAAGKQEIAVQSEADELMLSAHKQAKKNFTRDQAVNPAAGHGGESGKDEEGGSQYPYATGFALLGLGTSVLAAEQQAIKNAADFDDAIHRLYATAGETAPLETLSNGILHIASSFGLLPVEAAKAMYPIASVFKSADDQMMILANAANLSKGSMIDINTSANLITKSLYAWGLGADKAREMTDVLTRAIKEGDQPAQDYAAAFETLLKPATDLGLTFQETNAALAANVRTTKDSAQSATQLRALFYDLIHVTNAQATAATKLGLGWLANRDSIAHLQKVGAAKMWEEIATATHHSGKALGDLFPDMRKVGGIMGILHGDGKDVAKIFKSVADSFGAADAASKEMDKSLGQAQRNLSTSFQALEVGVGQALEPILVPLINGLSTLVDKISKLPQPVLAAVAAFTTFLAAGAALAGFLTIAGTAIEGIAAFAVPILAVAAAMTLIVAAWQADWGHIRETTASATAWLTSTIKSAAIFIIKTWLDMSDDFKNYWDSISPDIKQGMTFILDYIKFSLTLLSIIWNAAWKGTVDYLSVSVTYIAGIVRVWLDVLTGHWKKAWTDWNDTATSEGKILYSIFGGVLDTLEDEFKSKLMSMAIAWQAFWDTLKSTGNMQAAISAAMAGSSVGGAAFSAAQGAGNLAQLNSEAQSITIPTPLGRASCAYFASEFIKKQGIDIPTFTGAGDMAAFAATHGTKVPIGQTQPGDVIVYHGSQYGSKQANGQRSGYHVAAAVGNGYMAQSDDARNTVGPISAPGRGASITAYRLNNAGKAASMVDGFAKTLDALLGKDTTGPLGTKKTNPSFGVDTGKKVKGGGQRSLVGLPLGFQSHEALADDVIAENTKKHKAAIETATKAQQDYNDAMTAASTIDDDHSRKVAEQTAKLALLKAQAAAAKVAIDHLRVALTASAKDPLTGKSYTPTQAAHAEKQVDAEIKSKKDEMNAYSKSMHYKPDPTRYAELSREHSALVQQGNALYSMLESHKKIAVSLAHEIKQQQSLQDQMYKAKDIIKTQSDDYDKAVKSRYDAAMAYAQKGTPAGDIADRKRDIDTEAAKQKDALNSQDPQFKAESDAIDASAVQQKQKIDDEVYRQAKADLLEWQKFQLSVGRETLAEYQGNLTSMLGELIDTYATASYKNEALGKDIESIAGTLSESVWSSMNQEIQTLTESMESGHLTAQAYIADLKNMQGTAQPGSKQYDDPEKGILKVQEDKLKRPQGDEKKYSDQLGGIVADSFMQAFQSKGKVSLEKALKEAFRNAANEGVKEMIKGFVSHTAMTALKKAFPSVWKTPQSPQQTAADIQKGFADWLTNWQGSLKTLSDAMDRFSAAVDKFNGVISGTGETSAAGLINTTSSPGLLNTSNSGGNSKGAAGNTTKAASAISSDAAAAASVESLGKSLKPGIAGVQQVTGAISAISSVAKIGGTLSAAMPWIGAALAVGSLLGVFGNSKQSAPTSLSAVHVNDALSNFGSTIDTSKYAGTSGLRSLLGQESGASAGIHGNTTQSPGAVHHYDFSGMVINPAPGQNGQTVANQFIQTVQTALSINGALENSTRGSA